MGSLKQRMSSLCSYGSRNKDPPDPDGEEKKAVPQGAEGAGSRDVFLAEEPIVIEINGESITVDTKWATAQTSLARYLRTYLGMTGTKIMCAQAGCGACVVTATHVNPATGEDMTHSINSCITPVFKCNGWRITTVEGLGSTQTQLGEVQQRLNANYGTQCGFCTPGMVMAMNSLLQNNAVPEKEDIKEVLDGNICRCTGYRPIFDAFLSFNDDPITEIEDLVTGKGIKCSKTGKPCPSSCSARKTAGPSTQMQYIASVDGEWMKPETLDDLLAVLDTIENGIKYQLVAGNSGKGVFPNDGPYNQYIDVTGVSELQTVVQEEPYLLVGGNVTLTTFMTTLKEAATADPVGYSYCTRLAEHLKKVANTNVRNVGTVAGNLMMKHAHNDFESDIFNLMECVGAQISIMNTRREQALYSPREFLDIDMNKKILYFVSLPKLDSSYRFWTYKVTPRNQNAKAYVNGAILASVEEDSGVVTVLSTPRIVLGGISPLFFHAETVETNLVGKNLNAQNTLNDALAAMDLDTAPVLVGDELSSYKGHLAKALLYKFFLFAVSDNLGDSTLSSSITQLSWERGVPQSSQEYTDGDDTQSPLYQRVTKLEGKIQCTGEAEYVDDLEPSRNELFAAYVMGDTANSDFSVGGNLNQVLAMPGVKAFISASDIPEGGINGVTGTIESGQGITNEEIFSTGRIHYAGQAVGLIVADTYEHAKDAAKSLDLEYTNQETPILTIEDAVAEETKSGRNLTKKRFSKTYGARKGRATQEVSGEFKTGGQYHFHMENQSCLVRPGENGQYHVKSSTQYMDSVQNTVSSALGIAKNKVDVKTMRLGGAYGAKIFKPRGVAGACAIAAHALGKPVRLILDLETNMRMMGKRSPYLFTYSAGIDEDTLEIDYITVDVKCDVGFSMSAYEAEAPYVRFFIQSCYNSNEFNLTYSDVATNTPTATPCRAPTSAQCHAFAETVIEHLAAQIARDPLEVRRANLLETGDPLYTFDGRGGSTPYEGPNPIDDMITILSDETKGDYDTRKAEVEQFNLDNTFRKRGISLVPMIWFQAFGAFKYTVQVTAFNGDATVCATVGGIEMGQGLNTKVAQVIGSKLGIEDIDLITVVPSNTFVASNNDITGGSLGSDCCAEEFVAFEQAAGIACEKLLANIDAALGGADAGPQDWVSRVNLAATLGADLTGRHQSNPPADGVSDYEIHGVCIAEVEIDVLTGEKNVRRVDLMEDTGSSMSPLVDLGQVEGAFVMALGWWLSEEVTFDPESGSLLNFDTWTYKPPSSQDAPENFRTYLHDTGSNTGIFSSKATGEPPFLMGYSVMLALRAAVNAARAGGAGANSWFKLDGPATNSVVQAATTVTSDDFYI